MYLSFNAELLGRCEKDQKFALWLALGWYPLDPFSIFDPIAFKLLTNDPTQVLFIARGHC